MSLAVGWTSFERHTGFPQLPPHKSTGFPYILPMENRFDPAKDAANQ